MAHASLPHGITFVTGSFTMVFIGGVEYAEKETCKRFYD
jgi:hypothetical protein